MSAAEGVPLTRELLEALVEAAGMQSDMALPNVNLANVWYAVKQKCAAALASDAGTGEKCPFCDSSPCEGLDECRSYTAMYHRQAQAKPPASAAAPEESKTPGLLRCPCPNNRGYVAETQDEQDNGWVVQCMWCNVMVVGDTREQVRAEWNASVLDRRRAGCAIG